MTQAPFLKPPLLLFSERCVLFYFPLCSELYCLPTLYYFKAATLSLQIKTQSFPNHSNRSISVCAFLLKNFSFSPLYAFVKKKLHTDWAQKNFTHSKWYRKQMRPTLNCIPTPVDTHTFNVMFQMTRVSVVVARLRYMPLVLKMAIPQQRSCVLCS
jgi:hypothetical protein